ncbi:bifunctional 2-polyprenyl-6-hydroxyphenol methylase/3-demethylubiquinol 3-O-methyltransferase UbiG [Neobacillus niacini]|uniref:class I SAM-dependent methyltransferase n=1 Tax=Neobacillus niacini TaxID=86668 RepID=UPI0021CB538C|nr:methyltransferase domain-containing protein [Neobacillus niacini]MCM3764752.1 methyltransferase domain-containing protein [Neobacillus niacini]
MNDQTRWNMKYNERLQDLKLPHPNPRLQNAATYLTGGKALDLACGLGANSMFLAGLNYQVEAVDISDIAVHYLRELAVKKNLNIHARVCDLTREIICEKNTFDLVVITYYLDRLLLSTVKDLIKAKGYFFMETYYQSLSTDGQGMSNQYKLQPKELLREFADWTVIYFEEHEAEERQTIFCQKR